jgi:hypothetical protein
MRILACLLLLCVAGPALGDERLSFDFRGARFSPDYFRYGGPTPDKFMKPEAEGLRLRYTGADVPPTNTPASVAWRYHVRGDFVVTTRYEILKCEPPRKGTFYTGAELYLRLANANADFVTLARGVYQTGSAAISFKLLTTDAAGNPVTRDFKRQNTTERSLRGRLRLARNGPIVTGSFAEGDDAEFTEFQHSEIGNADIRLVRMTGTAGNDSQAVLDMRIVDFQLEGEALALDGQFATPLVKPDVPKPKADKPQTTPAVAQPEPKPEPKPASHPHLLLLAGLFGGLAFGLLVVAGIVLVARRRRAAVGGPHEPPPQEC